MLKWNLVGLHLVFTKALFYTFVWKVLNVLTHFLVGCHTLLISMDLNRLTNMHLDIRYFIWYDLESNCIGKIERALQSVVIFRLGGNIQHPVFYTQPKSQGMIKAKDLYLECKILFLWKFARVFQKGRMQKVGCHLTAIPPQCTSF